MRRKCFLILVLAMCLACKQELVIIHTNDTHAHYEPMRSGAEIGIGGLMERAAFVDSVRAAVGESNVLLLHAGDVSQGTSYFTELKGDFEPAALNALGYDCMVLGNHEFDNGMEDLARRLAMLTKTKVVSSNIVLEGLPLEPFVKPYAVFERAGRKIGVIGLEPNLSSNVSSSVSSLITELDDVEVVNKWAGYLRRELACDMVIVLSHCGYNEDIALVPQISGVDAIVGGHSHTFISEPCFVKDAKGKKIPVVTDGKWGFTMALLKLRF